MKDPYVFLCHEITREHALMLIDWLSDDEVRRYLSDSKNIAYYIEDVISRVNLPILTHIFNQNGRFFIAYDKNQKPIGFVRLIKYQFDYEIVVVIGDRGNWRRKYGTSMVRASLKFAFFEARAQKVIAKICHDNIYSLRLFEKAGFSVMKETSKLKILSITFDQFIASLKKLRTLNDEIYITQIDLKRIKKVLAMMNERLDQENATRLSQELQRAKVVDITQIPEDVVTMNSRVKLSVNNKELEVKLVYPAMVNDEPGNVSIVSTLGTAIIGYQAGDKVKWQVADQEIDIQIKQLIYQPEAAGDYDL